MVGVGKGGCDAQRLVVQPDASIAVLERLGKQYTEIEIALVKEGIKSDAFLVRIAGGFHVSSSVQRHSEVDMDVRTRRGNL
jgi:hypothetical protein